MSKKDFKVGLDMLFQDAMEDRVEEVANLEEDKKSGNKKNEKSKDMGSVIQEAIEESVIKKARQIKTGEVDKPAKKRTKPVFGLDSLIRQTIETSEVNQKSTTKKGTKRVTFAFDQTKIDQLKTIARHKNAYLKDIVGKLIAEYIEEYKLQDKA